MKFPDLIAFLENRLVTILAMRDSELVKEERERLEQLAAQTERWIFQLKGVSK